MWVTLRLMELDAFTPQDPVLIFKMLPQFDVSQTAAMLLEADITTSVSVN